MIREAIDEELSNKGMLSEAMTRITSEEVEAWKKGDWSFVSGEKLEEDHTHMDHMDADMGGEDADRFLHGHEHGHPHDDEGSMVKSRLYSMKEMAKDICDIVKPEDQLPGWVQDHISVAHENLQQVHGYLMGQQHATEHETTMDHIGESKKNLSEAHSRVTREEMDAWMRGDWGFVSEENES